MAKVIRYLPELEGDEQLYIATLMKEMTEEQAEQFSHVYRQRRKDPTLTLVTALAGFIGFAGIHRFLLNQIGMGLLYFFTAGLCLVGTVVDMINFKSLTYRFNQQQALDVAMLIKAAIAPSSEGPRRLGE
jgi:TM2 domain-containing membrane protein YozV